MQYYNNNQNSEDYFIIKAGRKATTSGLIAMVIAFSIAIFLASSRKYIFCAFWNLRGNYRILGCISN